MSRVIGVLLAAGAGSRMGRPKALVRHNDGTPWLVSSRQVLLNGGCHDVVTVLGAQAQIAQTLIPCCWTVTAGNWAEGMSASLAAGLDEIAGVAPDNTAAMIQLVDLPDVNADVVGRILPHAGPDALVRAMYDGSPGHPVLIGRNHWAALANTVTGDQGARHYLAQHSVKLVECGDLASGADVDTAPDGTAPDWGS